MTQLKKKYCTQSGRGHRRVSVNSSLVPQQPKFFLSIFIWNFDGKWRENVLNSRYTATSTYIRCSSSLSDCKNRVRNEFSCVCSPHDRLQSAHELRKFFTATLLCADRRWRSCEISHIVSGRWRITQHTDTLWFSLAFYIVLFCFVLPTANLMCSIVEKQNWDKISVLLLTRIDCVLRAMWLMMGEGDCHSQPSGKYGEGRIQSSTHQRSYRVWWWWWRACVVWQLRIYLRLYLTGHQLMWQSENEVFIIIFSHYTIILLSCW